MLQREILIFLQYFFPPNADSRAWAAFSVPWEKEVTFFHTSTWCSGEEGMFFSCAAPSPVLYSVADHGHVS
jgi:hypothetical protein